MQDREKLIYHHGRFTLYDRNDKDCIQLGNFNSDAELKAGEICVKTIMPKTKIGYFDGKKPRPFRVNVVQQVAESREANHLMDHSYIGSY